MTREEIEMAVMDSVKFANFAQRVKVAYWDACNKHIGFAPVIPIPENKLDEILLLAWEDFKKFKGE